MEKPILFSAPMVRAILEGRKTQTRRVVKPTPGNVRVATMKTSQAVEAYVDFDGSTAKSVIKCLYGKPGDRLWVRETFRPSERGIEDNPGYEDGIEYRADKAFLAKPASTLKDDFTYRWKPSIFMPRWASRIDLEITDIRVERLQEINETYHDDVLKEGWPFDMTEHEAYGKNPTSLFTALWDSINGKTFPWDSNPWVWVVEFKRINDTPVMEG